jgi:hypothetical protein
MYPLITALAGGTIVLLSVWSLVRAIADGGIFVNQLRFLVSGLLLAFHYPLVSLISGLMGPHLTVFEAVDLPEGAPFWSAVVLLVAAQLIVLPTGRELYATYLADRLSRRTAS